MENERENILSETPEDVVFLSHESMVKVDSEVLEPIVTLSTQDSSVMDSLIEESLQQRVGVDKEKHPVENSLVAHQCQALSRKNDNEIYDHPLMTYPPNINTSCVNIEVSTSAFPEVSGESDDSTVTDGWGTINDVNVPIAHTSRGCHATRRAARRGRGRGRGRGARSQHQTPKTHPALISNISLSTMTLAPSYQSPPASSALPANLVTKPMKASLPKPLPEPPKGADFLMVRRHLDVVLQNIITKVTRTGRKRIPTSTPPAAMGNIDTPESVDQNLKPDHPLVLETDAKTVYASVISNNEEQLCELECDHTIQHDENFATTPNQSSLPPPSCVSFDINKLANTLQKKIQSSPVAEVKTLNNITFMSNDERKCQSDSDVRRPTVSDVSLFEDENMVHRTTEVASTPSKFHIDEAARSSFPPFEFVTRSLQSVTQQPFFIAVSPSSESVASGGRGSVPELDVGSALPHFTFESNKFEKSREDIFIPPKRRHSEGTTELQSKSKYRGRVPVTYKARRNSVISANMSCKGELRETNQMGMVASTASSVSSMDSFSSPETQSSSTPLEGSILGLPCDVSPSSLDDSESSLSLSSLVPPGNYLTPKETKIIPPWRQRCKEATKLSEARAGNGSSVTSSTHCSGEIPDGTQHSEEGTALKMAKKHSKVVRSKACAPICDLCGRGFSSFCQLTSHIRLHTASERCFFCSLCKQRFLHFDALASHARRRHDVKLTSPKSNGTTPLQRPFAYSCSVCRELFVGRSMLVNHLLSKHSAPSGEAVQGVAPALLGATRMRGTAPCTQLGFLNNNISFQSRREILQSNTSSNAIHQSSTRDSSLGESHSLRKSPTSLAVCSKSISPFSSKTTISPPSSALSGNSVSELSDDSLSSNVSQTVNLLPNSHLHATQKHTQHVSKLVTSRSSKCAIHSSSHSLSDSSSSKVLSSYSSRNNSYSSLKSYDTEKFATSENFCSLSIKNGVVTIHDGNSSEKKDIVDSSSGKISSKNCNAKSIQNVSKRPCPIHDKISSSFSQNKTSVANSCPIHKPNGALFSHQNNYVSPHKDQPKVVLKKEQISQYKRKFKPYGSRHSNAYSHLIRTKKSSFNVHSNATMATQVTKSLQKSNPHSQKPFPAANVPIDPTSSCTTSGKGEVPCITAGKHLDPVVVLERIDAIESIIVE